MSHLLPFLSTSAKLFILLDFLVYVYCQYSPQNYPDPRTDPLSCRYLLPAQLCDPSDILTAEERRVLNDKIIRLQQITSAIRNTSPACRAGQNSNIQLVVALLNRLGTVPDEPVNIEQYANLLRTRFLNYQDTSQCDTFVLIVNSKSDRQVFTVAGRDAKLSRDVLQTAFHRNVGYFRNGHYALGIEGMIEYIFSSYTSAHIVQVPGLPDSEDRNSLAAIGSSNSIGAPFIAAQGVRQKAEQHKHVMEKFNLDTVSEDEKVWVEIMLKASALCGYDADKMAKHVRAVVEDAMALSLKLISDPRYTKIEEESQEGAEGREKAWETARTTFIDKLYEKYGSRFPRRANHCPVIEQNSVITRLLHRK